MATKILLSRGPRLQHIEISCILKLLGRAAEEKMENPRQLLLQKNILWRIGKEVFVEV